MDFRPLQHITDFRENLPAQAQLKMTLFGQFETGRRNAVTPGCRLEKHHAIEDDGERHRLGYSLVRCRLV